tara:strand:- start:1541 stop:3607 length:2067 start_codon:yes stop_codon:yes gene_type:complete
MSLNELQDIILAGDKDAGSKFVIERVLPDVISDDIYGTLALATNKKSNLEKFSVLSADELLIEGVEETIERGYEFFQIAGLALKNGASPNVYVTVPTDSGLTVLHIVVYAYRIFIERGEDYQTLIAIISLLCAAGADVRLPVTDRDILLKRLRKKENVPASVVMNQVGPVKSIMGWLSEQFRTEIGETEVDRIPIYLEDTLFKHIAVYSTFRDSLSDVKNAIREPIFTADSLGMKVPMKTSDYNSVAALSNEIGEVLDEPSHIGSNENVEKLSSLINAHANRCVKVILESRKVSDQPFTNFDLEEAFLEAIDAYNPEAMKLIMDFDFVPRYNHVDRVIFLGATKYHEELYLSAEIMTGILVSMGERGICFDREQMILISSYSGTTYEKINEIESQPYWRRLCSAPGSYVRSDVKALARELDLDPEMSKTQLCDQFRKIDLLTEKGGNAMFQKMRAEKKNSRSRLLGGDAMELVSEVLTGSSSPQRGTKCTNYSHLTRNQDTYSELDLHHIVDRNGETYCFESIDYPQIINSRINPYTSNQISTKDIERITSKYNTIRKLKLPLESRGIDEAISILKNGTSRGDYEMYVRANRDLFLDLIFEQGFERALFTEDFSIEDMQDIINYLFDRTDISLSPVGNREHAIRSFAMLFMEELNIRNLNPNMELAEEDSADWIELLVDQIKSYLKVE